MSKKVLKNIAKVKKIIKKSIKPKAKVKSKVKKACPDCGSPKRDLTTPKTKKSITLNVPTTAEQQAGVPSVISGDSFEGIKRIDHLSLTEQIDTVFNPLHTITKTTVTDAVSDATFIVKPKK